MLEINKLGRNLSINIRNEFQILLSILPTHNWPKKEIVCKLYSMPENSLKTLSIGFFGRHLSKNNLCQVSRLFLCKLIFEDSSKSRNWKEKHVLFYDTMKTFVQETDVIISLCWTHYPVLQSSCGCFLNFCTFSLLESTKRMVLKASFQTLQGHSFVWIYFPFPTPSLAPNTALQISSGWQEGWSQQGLCQLPLSALSIQALRTLLSTYKWHLNCSQKQNFVHTTNGFLGQLQQRHSPLSSYLDSGRQNWTLSNLPPFLFFI